MKNYFVMTPMFADVWAAYRRIPLNNLHQANAFGPAEQQILIAWRFQDAGILQPTKGLPSLPASYWQKPTTSESRPRSHGSDDAVLAAMTAL